MMKVKEAQDAVRALAASRRVERTEAAANCSEVNTTAVSLINLVLRSPGSPKVLFYCKKIIASNDLVCTQTEKDSLKALDAMFERAVDKLSGAELAAFERLANIIGAEQPLRVTPVLQALVRNTKKVKEAQAVVEALAATRRMEKAGAAATCTEVNIIAVQLNSLVLVSPESPEVLFYCDRIIASNHLVCTEAEKDSLKALDTMFETAVDKLLAEIWTAIELLETIEAATTTGAATTTEAATTG